MMMNVYFGTSNLSRLMAEDAGAPELRNPIHSGMRASGWLARLFVAWRK